MEKKGEKEKKALECRKRSPEERKKDSIMSKKDQQIRIQEILADGMT